MMSGLITFLSAGLKYKWLVAGCVASVALAAVLPAGAPPSGQGGEGRYIGEAEAKSIALENAGVAETDATFLKVHLDYEDRYVVYDVEFYSGNTEYDYEIDAVNGQIIEYDTDIEYYTVPSASAPTTGAGEYIGEQQAKSVALAHAGLAESSVTFIKAYLDYDDGRVVYDVEFYSENTEYDYEIDAVSGEIYEFDREIEYYSIPQAPQGGPPPPPADTGDYIGEAEAKSIALGHAGVAESEAANIRVHLDYDDGRVDYDVEFYVGDTEYEYEIDAVSGAILEYDRETEHRGGPGASGQPAPQPPQPQPVPGTADYIGEAQAKSIALSHAGLAESQVSRMRVKLDSEHGTTVYEVEFESGQTEYDYDIDAVSGAILEYDIEYDD